MKEDRKYAEVASPLERLVGHNDDFDMTDLNMGTFTIMADMIKRRPSVVADIFAWVRFVPFRAEYMMANDRVEYTGLSPKFTRLERGMAAPMYDLVVTEREGKILHADFVKI